MGGSESHRIGVLDHEVLTDWPSMTWAAMGWLSTTGLTLLMTTGKKINEMATTKRRIQPHNARPVATNAGFFFSTDSV